MLIWIDALRALLAAPRSTSERGLSQSTENALLVAGAVAAAVLIVTVVTAYVTGKLQELQ
jgi:hypothetical protein